MNDTPIRKEAGQTVEEMTAQLTDAKAGNRLYTPRRGNYKEISDQLKGEALTAAIDHQLQLLNPEKTQGKIDLDNVEEIRETAIRYMESCKLAGVYPTMLGFAPACGFTRKHIYHYIRTHNNASADYLDRLRSSWAAIIAQMGLERQCSESVAIFLLKNTGQDLADKQQIDLTATPGSPLSGGPSVDELNQKYIDSVICDLDVE